MKNQYLVTWELYRSWTLENSVKGIRLYMMIMWCVLLAACLFMGIATYDFLFFIFAVYCAYRAFLRNMVLANKQYKMLGNRYKKKEWIRTILFEDDRITVSEEDSQMKLRYSDIVRIRERGDKIWLDMQDKSVIRLYQPAFADTDWNRCKAWIESRREQKAAVE